MSSSIEVNTDSVTKVIRELENVDKKLKEALLLITSSVAMKMEEWMKNNAIWTDRTSNARQLLNGQAYWENEAELVLAACHGVDYGVWLELAHERKYAVLEKAIEQHKDELIKAWNKLVGD
jgi:hypothetical protein